MNRDTILGIAQIAISLLFLTGYFAVLAMFLTGWVKTPEMWRDALIALLGVITGGVGVILAFWFARSRTEVSK